MDDQRSVKKLYNRFKKPGEFSKFMGNLQYCSYKTVQKKYSPSIHFYYYYFDLLPNGDRFILIYASGKVEVYSYTELKLIQTFEIDKRFFNSTFFDNNYFWMYDFARPGLECIHITGRGKEYIEIDYQLPFNLSSYGNSKLNFVVFENQSFISIDKYPDQYVTYHFEIKSSGKHKNLHCDFIRKYECFQVLVKISDAIFFLRNKNELIKYDETRDFKPVYRFSKDTSIEFKCNNGFYLYFTTQRIHNNLKESMTYCFDTVTGSIKYLLRETLREDNNGLKNLERNVYSKFLTSDNKVLFSCNSIFPFHRLIAEDDILMVDGDGRILRYFKGEIKFIKKIENFTLGNYELFFENSAFLISDNNIEQIVFLEPGGCLSRTIKNTHDFRVVDSIKFSVHENFIYTFSPGRVFAQDVQIFKQVYVSNIRKSQILSCQGSTYFVREGCRSYPDNEVTIQRWDRLENKVTSIIIKIPVTFEGESTWPLTLEPVFSKDLNNPFILFKIWFHPYHIYLFKWDLLQMQEDKHLIDLNSPIYGDYWEPTFEERCLNILLAHCFDSIYENEISLEIPDIIDYNSKFILYAEDCESSYRDIRVYIIKEKQNIRINCDHNIIINMCLCSKNSVAFINHLYNLVLYNFKTKEKEEITLEWVNEFINQRQDYIQRFLETREKRRIERFILRTSSKLQDDNQSYNSMTEESLEIIPEYIRPKLVYNSIADIIQISVPNTTFFYRVSDLTLLAKLIVYDDNTFLYLSNTDKRYFYTNNLRSIAIVNEMDQSINNAEEMKEYVETYNSFKHFKYLLF
jgi:hypothetical protein